MDSVNDSTSSSAPSAFPAGRRWLPYSSYLQERFGTRVHKITLDAGFTCPNADGTKAVGGCIYCDNRSFNLQARKSLRTTLRSQFEEGVERLSSRYGERRFLAYFQAATNTYAPVDELKAIYDEVFDHPRVDGLILGTRPDCVPDRALDLIESYARRKYVSIEYGLQTLDDEILRWTNRGHDSKCFFDAVERTRGRGIDICVHVILGFPGESRTEAQALGEALGKIDIQGLKIHNLHVVKNTPLELLYRKGEIPLPSLDEYVAMAADVLERIRPTVAIQRLTGDAPGDWLVAPQWCRKKALVFQRIHAELEARGSWQGSRQRADGVSGALSGDFRAPGEDRPTFPGG